MGVVVFEGIKDSFHSAIPTPIGEQCIGMDELYQCQYRMMDRV